MSYHLSVPSPAWSGVETKVSTWDRLNALALAALILLGSFVAILFLLWIDAGTRPMEVTVEPPVLFGEFGAAIPEGVADDVLEPGVEDFPELKKSQLADALLAVTSAVSSIEASNELHDRTARFVGPVHSRGFRNESRTGGDGMPGWQVNLEAIDRSVYARQLSFFGIQIAAVNETSNDVFRLADPGGGLTLTPSSKGAEKSWRTVLFTHANPRLREWDKELLRKAGRDPQGFVVGQIYPQELINNLRAIEIDYTRQQGRDLAEIRTTSFRIVESGNGFSFEITGQTYRR